MNNNYMIPANSKKGQLIFNIFRTIDLVLVVIGAVLTGLLMIIFNGHDSLAMIFIKLLPLGVCVLLVIPIPYYHNVLVFLTEAYTFISTRSKFQWKGWCVKSEFADEQQK